MPLYRNLLMSLSILFGTLVFSGCNPKHPEATGKPTPQGEGQVAPPPTDTQIGQASWYGPGFQGQETASGENFDKKAMTAAHPSLPMGTKAEITNLDNGRQVEVTINDRGPYAKGRAIDLSSGAANKLDMKKDGTTPVKIETAHKKKRSRSGPATPSRTP